MTQIVTAKRFFCIVKRKKNTAMRKELTCNIAGMSETALREFSIKGMTKHIGERTLASKPVMKLAQLYSFLLEEKVSPRRALRFLNASAAITLLVCVNGSNIVAALVLTAWTAVACRGCRKRD